MDQKVVRQSLRLCVWLYFAGFLAFWLFSGMPSASWFAVGGALALGNMLISYFAVRTGFKGARNKALVMTLVMGKSISFLALIGVVILVFKPLFLPFTAGVLLVIFALVLWAVKEAYMTRRAAR